MEKVLDIIFSNLLDFYRHMYGNFKSINASDDQLVINVAIIKHNLFICCNQIQH